MTLTECEKKAIDIGFNSCQFEIFIPSLNEWVKAKWLDAYFGIFEVEGKKGFFNSVDCEDYECRLLTGI